MSVSFDKDGEMLSRAEFIKRGVQFDFHFKERYIGRCLGGSGSSSEYVSVTSLVSISAPNYSNGYSVSDLGKDLCSVVFACSVDGGNSFGYLKCESNGPIHFLIFDDFGNCELWRAGTSVSDTEYHFANAGRYRIFYL